MGKETFVLTIKPAVPPEIRHKIEDVLSKLDYDVHGGGQHTDGTASDITFSNGASITNQCIVNDCKAFADGDIFMVAGSACRFFVK